MTCGLLCTVRGITRHYHFLCLEEAKAVPRSRSPGDASDSKPGTVTQSVRELNPLHNEVSCTCNIGGGINEGREA